MTVFHEDIYSWFLLRELLEWVKVLAATHIGFRLVHAYASRSRHDYARRTLERRVRELEQLTESLGARQQQVLEAEQFAVALMLRRGAGQPRDTEPANAEANPEARGG